ncbi:MAG TPA: hypothetical protein VMV77_05040, partial [Bacteroidales bacterium]|nr:hypothetical protein [Bacteroidales bacterium]
KFNPGKQFKIGLVDKKDPSIDYSLIPFEIVEVEELRIPDFEDFYLKYTITELSTSVKPFYFKHFSKLISENKSIVYLDPDIMVYDRFNVLEDEIKNNNIIITPHFTTPINDDLKQREEDFLNSGLYNLGFLALKKSSETDRMIDWWGERLKNKAYIALEKGLFTDQIWINFVPLFFSGVKILLHPGYNVAYWNLHERKINGNAVITDKNEISKLVFFHYSGYNPEIPEILSKYQTRYSFDNRPDVVSHFESYKNELYRNGFAHFSKIQCLYTLLRDEYVRGRVMTKIKEIPLYKRILRLLILRTISYFNIIVDYSVFK